jgi:hypothetical protein
MDEELALRIVSLDTGLSQYRRSDVYEVKQL